MKLQVKVPEPPVLSLADMWSISGQLLHTPSYRHRHATLLAAAIGNPELDILDAACGTGFPLIELYELGFRHLAGSDADADLLAAFRAQIAAQHPAWRPDITEARWQDLPARLTRQFDVVLNVDAAIGFMDSWLEGDMRTGAADIFARVVEVLGNFHAMIRPGGRFFIGLQKNNHKGNSYYPMLVGKMRVGQSEAEAHWHMTYDWETRIKTWVNIVRVDGREHAQTRRSYLFDLDELAGFLLQAGFARTERLPTPDALYEDILIAHRAPA